MEPSLQDTGDFFRETFSGSRVPAYEWTHGVEFEDSARAQIANLTRMPFMYRHVAVMPDAHWGNGATVGSVLATKGAIIPAAVGVDLGCFVGETRVPLLDGTQATLRALAERTEPFWVYSIDNVKMTVAPGRAICKKTRSNASLMRITVSGGEEIVCTPDHPFMLNDGSYCEARNLRFNESLMPLYRKWETRDGYETVSNGKGTGAHTHRMVWEALNGKIPDGYVVHHQNVIHFDNRPDNMELMTMSDHSAHHRAVGRKFDNGSATFQRSRMAGIKRRSEEPVSRAAMVDVGKRNIAKYMTENPDHFKESTRDNGKRGAPFLKNFNTKPRSCSDCDFTASNPANLFWHTVRNHGVPNPRLAGASNHKVIKTELLTATADVYCLQVEEHHNFALAAGVFVHNCGMNAVRTTLTASDLPDDLGPLRAGIEKAVPHGRTNNGGVGDRGAWHDIPGDIEVPQLHRFYDIIAKHPKIGEMHKLGERACQHFGTLGTGNHFIEVCLDEEQRVWLMLHSGSRGIGNRIGSYFITKAKEQAEQYFYAGSLPDQELAYLVQGTPIFDDYLDAVGWAQDYAYQSRHRMMNATVGALAQFMRVGDDYHPFKISDEAINCFASETEVLTHSGLRSIKSLAGNSSMLLTANGAWVEAPVSHFGKQEILRVTLSRCGTKKDIYTTPKHKWIVSPVQRNYVVLKDTVDLCSGDRLAYSFPKRESNYGVDEEAAARGFVFGDGSVTSTNRSRATFCGAKDAHLIGIFAANGFGLPPRSYPYGVGMSVINGLLRAWKDEFPSIFCDDSYLYGWLAGYFAADGDVDATGRPTLSSAKVENLEFVRTVCTRLGIGTFGIRKRERLGFGKKPSSLYLIGIMRNDLDEQFFLLPNHRERFISCMGRVAERRSWSVVKVERTGRFEDVFCATVPETHSFTLGDNILTRNCHHNYVARERHFGQDGIIVTRKGAVRAQNGDLGIIPGSMGAKSFIVRGKGNRDSFHSCSHGAGRRMGRKEAIRNITLEDFNAQMGTIESRRDKDVIDEAPQCYKSIDAVIAAQSDLIDVVHTLRQVLCVKG